MISRAHLPPFVLFLCTTAMAQSHVTSPSGFLGREGPSSTFIGGYANGRYMYIDEDMIGQSMVIREIAFRHDNELYTTAQGMGRSWTNVTLDLSNCDPQKLSNTFTRNPTSTPTRVLSSSVSWPTQTGKPTNFPADFNLNLPFRTVWNYGGSAAICADLIFRGGVLANNAAWSGATSKGYQVDGVDPATAPLVRSTEFGESGHRRGCNDRNLNNLYGAQVTSDLTYYSKTFSTQNYAGNLVFRQMGNYFGPNAIVYTAVGIRPQSGGWDLPGVGCNKVYLDPGLILALIPQSANPTGSLPMLSFGGAYGVPAPPGISGTTIVTQAFWRDTKNQSVLLSSAAVLTVPETPLESRHQLVWSHDNTATIGNGPSTNNANVLFRYTR